MAHAPHHHLPRGDEAPLDAANQALADALRAFFNLLKFLMLILVGLYCFSGVQCVEDHEQAVVFRFGKLLSGVRTPGLSWAFPSPIDETLVFPAEKSSKLVVKSHWPSVPAGKESEPLSTAIHSRGLKPGLDGALLTADRGLVHFQWVATYRIGNLQDFVLSVGDQMGRKTEEIIAAVLESSAVSVVSQFTAERATRGQSAVIAELVRAKINDQLQAQKMGLYVVALDIPRSSVPAQTVAAFDEVTKAENNKQNEIRKAQQRASEILNQTAGAAHHGLIDDLDAYDKALAVGDQAQADLIAKRIETMLDTEAGGAAGAAIRRAKGFYTVSIQRVRGDVEEYEAALAQYLESKDLFVSRMWEQTRRKVLQYDEVTKHFVFGNNDELRIKIGPDPLQRKIDETKRLLEEARDRRFDPQRMIHSRPDL